VPSFVPATEIIRANPHPLFDKLAERGYELWYLKRDDEDDIGPGFALEVEVRHRGNTIGVANFDYEGPQAAWCRNVRVEPAHRRQGLANAMYVFAENALQRTLIDHWGPLTDTSQSEEGRALWTQLNRPFGNPRLPNA
jgi:GNAT superfamily N-acetyltransferase